MAVRFLAPFQGNRAVSRWPEARAKGEAPQGAAE
jgi:hypothetical protein